jgi:hypothetical protein
MQGTPTLGLDRTMHNLFLSDSIFSSLVGRAYHGGGGIDFV